MEVAEGNELVGGADQATNINSTPILCTHGPSLSQAGHKHACPPSLMHACTPPPLSLLSCMHAPPTSHLSKAQAQLHIFRLHLLHCLTQGLTVLDTLRAGEGGGVRESWVNHRQCALGGREGAGQAQPSTL